MSDTARDGRPRFRGRRPRPGPAMRRRLAGFVLTLRDAGFVIGQAEAQDAARLMAGPLAERPEGLRAAIAGPVRVAPLGPRAVRRPLRRLLARARGEEPRQDRRRGAGRPLAPALPAWARRERSPSGAGPHRRRPRARRRRRGRRRPAGRRVRARGDVEEGHRGVRGRAGARRGRRDRRTLRARDARQAHAARARAPARAAARLEEHDPAQRRPRRRAARPQVPPAQDQAAAARGAARRLRLDGALCRFLHPLPARGDARRFASPRRSCFIPGSRMSRRR